MISLVLNTTLLGQKLLAAVTPMPDIHNPILPTPISQLSGLAFLQKGLTLAINLFLISGAVVFVFIFLIGAIKWITAGGDKAGMESAQKTITNALIGLAILLSIFAIIGAIEFFFDIKLTRLKLPSF
ncbi:MAG TPA: hypothetical protein VMW04_03050 [Patescibacteria group bacterium]|nr:hypothetical protein [Patescibacteria group bacterium]